MSLRRLAIFFCGLPALAATATRGEDNFEKLKPMVYTTCGDESMEADVYVPQGTGPFPAAVVVHGGAWTHGTRRQVRGVSTVLAQHGYVAVAIDYRLAPKHKFPAQIDDCRAGRPLDAIRANVLKLDPLRIAAVGYSAGGHLVSLLGVADDPLKKDKDKPASRDSADRDSANRDIAEKLGSRVQAVVAGGAPCDFRLVPLDSPMLSYWLGGTRGEKQEAYRLASPLAFVSADDPPMFFYHGDQDLLVPTFNPSTMKGALDRVGVTAELFMVPEAGHVEAFFDQPALEKACEFLDAHLKKL